MVYGLICALQCFILVCALYKSIVDASMLQEKNVICACVVCHIGSCCTQKHPTWTPKGHDLGFLCFFSRKPYHTFGQTGRDPKTCGLLKRGVHELRVRVRKAEGIVLRWRQGFVPMLWPTSQVHMRWLQVDMRWLARICKNQVSIGGDMVCLLVFQLETPPHLPTGDPKRSAPLFTRPPHRLHLTSPQPP